MCRWIVYRARRWRLALAVGLLLAVTGSALAAPPRLVATILPLHGIAAAIGAGRLQPELLIPPAASPHLHPLSPGEARRLARAELVLWVGPELETALVRPLATLASRAERLTARDLAGVRLLPLRLSRAEEEPDAGHGAIDPHLWLDPFNGLAIARALTDRLVARDPAGAALYRRNLAQFEARLAALVEEVRQRLAPVRTRPFILAHDSLQYFERAFDLRGLGAIAVSPELPPGARALMELVARARAAGVVCVFAEPQLDRRRVELLAAMLDARIGLVDPLGRDIPPGPEAYFTLLERTAESVAACLGAG